MTMQATDPNQAVPQTTATVQAAPAAPPTAQQPVASTPPAAPAPQPPAGAQSQEPAQDPNWLTPRLKRERERGYKEALAAAGFSSPEEAAEAGKRARAAAEANKTAEQRALDAQNAYAAEKARADSAYAFASENAARMMAGLTPAQAQVVRDLAGDDPIKQGLTITKLAPTWAKQEEAAKAAQVTQTATPTAAVALPSTAPGASAPNPVVPPPATTRGRYEEMKKENPFAAASFGAVNPSVYNEKKS